LFLNRGKTTTKNEKMNKKSRKPEEEYTLAYATRCDPEDPVYSTRGAIFLLNPEGKKRKDDLLLAKRPKPIEALCFSPELGLFDIGGYGRPFPSVDYHPDERLTEKIYGEKCNVLHQLLDGTGKRVHRNFYFGKGNQTLDLANWKHGIRLGYHPQLGILGKACYDEKKAEIEGKKDEDRIFLLINHKGKFVNRRSPTKVWKSISLYVPKGIRERLYSWQYPRAYVPGKGLFEGNFHRSLIGKMSDEERIFNNQEWVRIIYEKKYYRGVTALTAIPKIFYDKLTAEGK
jgi:hypothetical protein